MGYLALALAMGMVVQGRHSNFLDTQDLSRTADLGDCSRAAYLCHIEKRAVGSILLDKQNRENCSRGCFDHKTGNLPRKIELMLGVELKKGQIAKTKVGQREKPTFSSSIHFRGK